MLNSMTHEAKVVAFVAGAIRHFKDSGLAGGSGDGLTPKGIAGFDQLEASGFRPTGGEARAALAQLRRMGLLAIDDHDLVNLVTLVANWDQAKQFHP